MTGAVTPISHPIVLSVRSATPTTGSVPVPAGRQRWVTTYVYKHAVFLGPRSAPLSTRALVCRVRVRLLSTLYLL
jgi:hypothetical protein